MSVWLGLLRTKFHSTERIEIPLVITRRWPGGVEAALATWDKTKSLICRIFPKVLEIPAASGDGGGLTDPAKRPEEALRRLALRKGGREDMASGDASRRACGCFRCRLRRVSGRGLQEPPERFQQCFHTANYL